MAEIGTGAYRNSNHAMKKFLNLKRLFPGRYHPNNLGIAPFLQKTIIGRYTKKQDDFPHFRYHIPSGIASSEKPATKPSPESLCSKFPIIYRIKFVIIPGSLSGCGWPPFFKFFNIQAMLFPKVRIVCKPSASCDASPGLRPCTLFQYWELTTGMQLMVKYLFRRSKVALAPPRRHTATAAAGL